MTTEPAVWKSCSSCKGDIGFEEIYYVCGVSTCQRGSTDFRFCSVECWDTHVPVMRHRDASAVERRSPSREQFLRENPPPPAHEPEEDEEGPEIELSETNLPDEVLVVVSKLKAYIKARSGMNTSDGVLPVLSRHLRGLCDDAIRRAGRAGRKTVMDRDFESRG